MCYQRTKQRLPILGCAWKVSLYPPAFLEQGDNLDKAAVASGEKGVLTEDELMGVADIFSKEGSAPTIPAAWSHNSNAVVLCADEDTLFILFPASAPFGSQNLAKVQAEEMRRVLVEASSDF